MRSRGCPRWLRACCTSGHNKSLASTVFHGTLYLAGDATHLARKPIAPSISRNITPDECWADSECTL